MTDSTEVNLTAIRLALDEARQLYKATHFPAEDGLTHAERLERMGEVLFSQRLDSALKHQPDPQKCPEQLRSNFIVLQKAAETARIIYKRHAEEPRTESEIFIMDAIGLFLHNRFVDAAAGFEELFEWIYSPDIQEDDIDP
jgi:hypothetical protein